MGVGLNDKGIMAKKTNTNKKAKSDFVASPGKKLVIVESPTKARTIRKFLDNGYYVESCMGHIRDLPQSAKDIPEKFKKEKWANLGVDVDHDFEPIYCVPKNKEKVVTLLRQKLKDSSELILATDEDREGESISWHLVNVLKPKMPVKRMVFNEITKEAIHKALTEFRDIDMHLVSAQEARRILDRLVGYTISPLLWKKVAYGLSAGRVQSVAVRLIVEREHARLKFVKATYWDVLAKLLKASSEFEAKIYDYEGKRVASGKDFDADTGLLLKDKSQLLALTEKQARDIISKVKADKWLVAEVEEKPVSRKPAPPFITSTLQQEGNRKLGLTSREVMQIAQKLYEKGMITYMRTDSMFLSEQALQAARSEIQKRYGKNFLPAQIRDYGQKKVKGAQEAHEAIRPAGTQFVFPDESDLTGFELKLYDLIWKRTMASQMVNSEHKQVSAKIKSGPATFSASGMTVEFAGFLKVYQETVDEDNDNAKPEVESKLPQLKVGDVLGLKDLTPEVHETKPPARFTEASLIQLMEKEGIGRPSTYASILGTIQDRGYVRKSGSALAPTFTAMIVTKLLSQYLPKYVETGFTSNMEKSLDDIAGGDLNHHKYLASIYLGAEGLKKQVEKQEKSIDGDESRSIEFTGLKGLTFKVGKFGAYVCRKEKGDKEICASIPDNVVPGEMTMDVANKLIDQKINGADSIGKDPVTGMPVYVLSGRFGPYVQLGEVGDDDAKPKRMAIPAGTDPAQVDLQQALWLLSLPKKLGDHPTLKKDVKLGIGRFGPYVVVETDYRSIPKTENLYEMDLKKALDLLSQPKKGRGRAAPVKELGVDPKSKEQVLIYNGKYGFYVKVGATNVSIPNGVKVEDVKLEQALEWVLQKAGPQNETKKPIKKKAASTSASKRQ
jgi:DNA topoisomerase-1